VSTLHDDVTFSMPPLDFWLRGLDTVVPWLDTLEEGCRNTRFVRVGTANGMPAFGQYQPKGPDGLYVARGIQVVEISDIAGPRIIAVHSFLDPTLFGWFDLPLQRSFDPIAG
jgi:RNA polymerase sigma-70 factor (ECF subfamily)